MTDKLEATLVCIPLSDLAEVRTGIAKGKPFDSDCVEVPYLRVANVQDGRLDLREVKSLRVAVAVVDRYRLRSGDVLLTEGGDIDKLGRGCVWHGQVEPCLHQNHVFAVRPKVHLLDATYLAAVAGSDYGRQYFLGCAKRTTNLASINSSQLKAFPVPFRPLPEQQKIAAILTAVDDKLDLIARQISATQTLKQGLMQTLFTRGAGTPDSQGRWHPHTAFQDTELGRIPVGWRVGRLQDYIAALRSGVSVNAEDRIHGEDEVGVLKVSCVLHGKFYSQGHKAVPPEEMARVAEPVQQGRIIISRANTPALVGESAYVDRSWPDLFLPDKLWQTEPSETQHSVKWLAFYLQSSFVREEISKAATGTSGSMKNIAKQAFLNIAMPLVPVAEQERVAELLTSVDDKLEVLTTQQTHYQSLKRGLMQKLLTGQWRVRVDAATLAPIHEKAPA